MSGNSIMDPEQWTVATLRVYLESKIKDDRDHFDAMMIEKDKRDQQRFDGQGEAINAALAAQKEAAAKSETAAEERFVSFSKNMTTKVDVMVEQVAGMSGRSRGVSDAWAWIIGGVGVIVGAAGVAVAIISAAT